MDHLFANSGPFYKIMDLLFERAILPNPPGYGPELLVLNALKTFLVYAYGLAQISSPHNAIVSV